MPFRLPSSVKALKRSQSTVSANQGQSPTGQTHKNGTHFVLAAFENVTASDGGAYTPFDHGHTPFPEIDIIGAMVIVWRVRGKIIRSVLCSIVCNSCAQCNAHTYEHT